MVKLSIIKYVIFFFVIMIFPFIVGTDAAARHSWEYYYEKGQTQTRLGMYNEAVLTLQSCMELNPRFYQGANLLADVYCRLNQRHLAIPWYKRSLEINNNQSDINVTLGELYEFFSENELAYDQFSRAVAIDPDSDRARCRLVRFCVLRGDYKTAREHLEISYRKEKARSDKRLSAAAKAAEAGNDAKAAELYGKTIEDSPCITEAYLALYEIHKRKGEFAAAAEVLERLKKIRPDYEKVYVLLGYVYYNGKMPGSRKLHIELALSNLKKAVELNPDNFEACYSISEIYAFIRKDIEAKQWEKKGMQAEDRSEGKD